MKEKSNNRAVDNNKKNQKQNKIDNNKKKIKIIL